MALLYWCTHINMKYTNELNLYCQFICVFHVYAVHLPSQVMCKYNGTWKPLEPQLCKVFQDSYVKTGMQSFQDSYATMEGFPRQRCILVLETLLLASLYNVCSKTAVFTTKYVTAKSITYYRSWVDVVATKLQIWCLIGHYVTEQPGGS